MKRSELEHVIRASGAIADDREVVIIGSQAILGQFPGAPAVLLSSMETDLYPRNRPERAELVDGAIGEGSQFHKQFGYYAQGVGPETAVLPGGWEDRLIRIENVNTNGVAGLCLEVHDLAISKYVAGRPKDLEYTRALAAHALTRRSTLLERLRETKVPKQLRTLVRGRINADFARQRQR
jgi:hypothetical protein